MFYYFAKIVALLVLPSSAGLIAVCFGLVLLRFERWRRIGFGAAAFGAGFLVLAGFSPVANWVLYPLEQRFSEAALPKAGEKVTGIIILGGFEDAWVTGGRPGLGLNEAAERLTEGLRLAHRWPQAKVVFTGGAVPLFNAHKDASGPIGAFLSEMGIDKSRIVLEGKSRDTFENAVFTRALVSPKPGDTWLLVTSAYHMPRAMGVFRKAGFVVRGAPVDYRTRDARDLGRFFYRASQGLMRVDVGVKEWLGLFVYWVSGRSSAIFPGPDA